MRRYISLPLWVVDIPQAAESPLRGAVHAQQRSVKRNKFRSMRPGPTNMQSLPPVDVVVRYVTRAQFPVLHETWRRHDGWILLCCALAAGVLWRSWAGIKYRRNCMVLGQRGLLGFLMLAWLRAGGSSGGT